MEGKSTLYVGLILFVVNSAKFVSKNVTFHVCLFLIKMLQNCNCLMDKLDAFIVNCVNSSPFAINWQN